MWLEIIGGLLGGGRGGHWGLFSPNGVAAVFLSVHYKKGLPSERKSKSWSTRSDAH